MPKSLLVTGSSGLVGSEVCRFFTRSGYSVHGMDSHQRAVFFGPQADTRWNQERLARELAGFTHHETDIRDRQGVQDLLRRIRPSVIVHAAAQPSHDRAAQIPFDDFDTNAVGTLNLLEAARQVCPEAPFVFLSSNKVYGDRVNQLDMRETPTRWEFADPSLTEGIAENFPVDQSLHSLFGISKLSADLLVQEYGRYFGMPTCALRGGCLTGPQHAGVSLHGFLSYLVQCNLTGSEYTVCGYQGKQVRDNLHALDVASFVAAYVGAPRAGEVYNLGGGRANSTSLLEAFTLVEAVTGRTQIVRYSEETRRGDHRCYYTDLRKARSHYPGWRVSVDLPEIVRQLVVGWRERQVI